MSCAELAGVPALGPLPARRGQPSRISPDYGGASASGRSADGRHHLAGRRCRSAAAAAPADRHASSSAPTARSRRSSRPAPSWISPMPGPFAPQTIGEIQADTSTAARQLPATGRRRHPHQPADRRLQPGGQRRGRAGRTQTPVQPAAPHRGAAGHAAPRRHPRGRRAAAHHRRRLGRRRAARRPAVPARPAARDAAAPRAWSTTSSSAPASPRRWRSSPRRCRCSTGSPDPETARNE